MRSKNLLLITLLWAAIITSSCAGSDQVAEQDPITAIDGLDQGFESPDTLPFEDPDDGDCPNNLTADDCRSLNSLSLVDDYPLYTMRIWGPTPLSPPQSAKRPSDEPSPKSGEPGWGCSLFAAFADPESRLFGRNFDWRYSPALLLLMDPPDAYASVSMVDYDYLGFSGKEDLTQLSISERERLLEAPLLPFDGVNEKGLAIGMAAVPIEGGAGNHQKKTIGSLGIMREVLDNAGDVGEAVEIFHRFSIDMGGGPPLHYLLADASGQSVLVEFWEGEMILIAGDNQWHQATNFITASVPEVGGHCWRYDVISDIMFNKQGSVDLESAFELLKDVSQANTQWSVVYNMSEISVSVAIGRDYDHIYDFKIPKE